MSTELPVAVLMVEGELAAQPLESLADMGADGSLVGISFTAGGVCYWLVIPPGEADALCTRLMGAVIDANRPAP